jgi:hypothetical protein
MAQKLTANLAPDLDLAEFYTIQFAALDPSTGLPVSGVTVSGCQIIADNIGDAPSEALSVGPFMLVPGPPSS